MVLLQLVVELLERLEVLDDAVHLFDFLREQTVSEPLQKLAVSAYLAQGQVALGQLDRKSVV